MARAVGVPDLYKLRSALRKINRDEIRNVQKLTKDAAGIVATQASKNAPHGTRPLSDNKGRTMRLAEGYKASTSGARGVVRNRLPHAAIYEYRKSGTPGQMRKTRPVDRALEMKQNEVADRLQRGWDDVCRRNGMR